MLCLLHPLKGELEDCPSGVRNTRHSSPTGSDSCANGSLPSARTVGEPLNRSRSASYDDATSTSTTSASTPASGTA